MKNSVVQHIAKLANIPTTDQENEKIATAFDETLKVVDQLQKVNVDGIEPTHQVTGLMNVLRDDVVDESRMFTQEEALSNAKHTYDGFIVVDQILEQSQ